jgi:hypothetical protein
MAGRKIPGIRNLSAGEVRTLSKLPWVADKALSELGEARVLPDGRVLVCSPDNVLCQLYPSREALAEANRRFLEAEREAAEQVAAGYPDTSLTLLPPIDDFIRDADAHAKSLGKTIKVADEVLDRSVQSLDAVDKAMKRTPWAKRQVPEIVTPLTAYVGEVLRRASGGRWTKATKRKEVSLCDPAELAAFYSARRKSLPIAAPPHRVEVREDSEPVITGHDGRLLQPFAIVYLPMVEPSRRIPLRAAVDVYLLPYRPGSAGG